jgi:hypothetical protein
MDDNIILSHALGIPYLPTMSQAEWDILAAAVIRADKITVGSGAGPIVTGQLSARDIADMIIRSDSSD